MQTAPYHHPQTSSLVTMAAATTGLRPACSQLHNESFPLPLIHLPSPSLGPVTRGTSPSVSCLAGPPWGRRRVRCLLQERHYARHQSNGKMGFDFRHHPTLGKERSLSSFLLLLSLCLALASCHLSLSIQGKGHGLTPMIWIGAPPLRRLRLLQTP